MAIIKTYPLKSNYYGPDRLILSDMQPDDQGIVHGTTKSLTLSNLKTFVGSQVIDVSASTDTRYAGAFVSPSIGNVKVGIDISSLPSLTASSVNEADKLIINSSLDNKKLRINELFETVGLTTNSLINYSVKLPNSVGGPNQVLQLPSTIGASPYQLEWTTPAGSGTVIGTGTIGRIPKWQSTTGLDNSEIFQSGTNIGIGTTTPSAKLDILDTIDQTAIRVTNNQYNNYLIQKRRTDNSQILGIQEFGSNGGLSLVVGGAQRLNVNNLGNVGIGTTSPLSIFQISDQNPDVYITSADTGQSDIFFGGTTTPAKGNIKYSDNADAFIFSVNSNTEALRIVSAGDVGIGTTVPDSILTVKAATANVGIPVIKSSVNGFANGFTLIGDNYIAGESQFNLGISYSGANGVLSRGVKVSNTTDDVFLSSQDAYSTNPNAFILDRDGSFRFLNTSTSASTPVGTAVNLSERMRIASTGNVGIGTTNPTADGLEVANKAGISGGNTQLFITGNTTGRSVLGLGDGANKFVQHILADHTQNMISFHTGATSVTNNERMRIASDGKVGIGTTSPQYNLDVNGNLRAKGITSSAIQTVTIEGTVGWYRLMEWDGASRGGAIVKLSTTGGNVAPTTYVINAYKTYGDPAATNTLKLEQYGNGGYITKARIATDSVTSVTYVEIYNVFTSANYTMEVYHDSLLGLDSLTSLLTGTLQQGPNSVSQDELPFVHEGTTTEKSSSELVTLIGDGTNDGKLRFNCSANSHYVEIVGPTHSGGSSYSLKLPNTLPNVSAQILQSNASGVLGWIPTPSGGGSGGGTITSVGLTMPSAFSVTNSPLSGTGGTISVGLTGGSAGQYLDYQGNWSTPSGSGGGISFSGSTPGGLAYFANSSTASVSSKVTLNANGLMDFDSDGNSAGSIDFDPTGTRLKIGDLSSGNSGIVEIFTNGNRQFQIGVNGEIGLGTGGSQGTSGLVLTSGGNGTAPTWTAKTIVPANNVTGAGNTYDIPMWNNPGGGTGSYIGAGNGFTSAPFKSNASGQSIVSTEVVGGIAFRNGTGQQATINSTTSTGPAYQLNLPPSAAASSGKVLGVSGVSGSIITTSWQTVSTSSVNIGNTDLSLTSARALDLDGYDLQFRNSSGQLTYKFSGQNATPYFTVGNSINNLKGTIRIEGNGQSEGSARGGLLEIESGEGNGHVQFKGPQSMSAGSYAVTLPSSLPASNILLTGDQQGNLSWNNGTNLAFSSLKNTSTGSTSAFIARSNNSTTVQGWSDNLGALNIYNSNTSTNSTQLAINCPSKTGVNYAVSFYYNSSSGSGSQGSITVGGTSVSYNTSSDYRLKENIVEMTGAVDRVKQLKPSRFNFIAEPSKIVDGFLAHEVSPIVPESVIGEKDGETYQGIDQSKLVPLLVGAIKELTARIEALEA
jgi:hypothetical protein